MRPLLVIDGDSLAHRAFHALPSIAGSGGRPINALVGFANMLLALIEAEAPRATLVCWDTLEVPTYRHRELPAYQAHRPPFDEELVEQLSRLPEMVEAFGLAASREPGFEADDLLATAARLEREEGRRTLVVTSDRDAYQLVDESVTVLAPQGAAKPPARIGTADVRERYGVDPGQVPDFIALRGDPSDGIPGALGIGAKTAASLLGRFGTLEAAIAARDSLPPRQAAGLGDPLLLLYRRIATMDAHAPLRLPADNSVDRRRAAAHAASLGADNLAGRLERSA